ncbi:50S ribosomal protein L11 methyltransferase [uncultured Methylibium sp.]|uniref:50S ribosomal protein L11 methyltransferase n=1 Tax=uncultured Methylibium sp. TaxID=381093 RepID=UPI0025FED757|nr:50S ribosomal protein L11 methyltransferase [uncultured Methylibium sp.]
MHELVLRAPEAAVETLSDALMELEALSVSVEDADADTPAEQALFGEPDMPAPAPGWQQSTLRALFADEAAATAAATLLLSQDWAAGVVLQAIEAVPDQDWVRLTQSQFAPVEITPTFWIVPTWHEAPAAATQVIRLDPGLAFGTGTHPTTRMCLRWIAGHETAVHGARVLDYGCGSGILAIGAARFGAAEVVAVDIDPAALQSTRDNAAANGVAFAVGSPDAAGPPSAAYPVVLANILATPLKLLAPLLGAHVARGGHLVLAGILARQAQELQAAYAPQLALQVADEEDGWILMTARRAD